MSKTKQDLIDAISERADIPKTTAETVVNEFTSYVTKILADGDKLTIVGWGSFGTGDRAARVGRNPQTGAEMQIPAARVVKFKAGKKLKDAVNETA